MTRRSFLGAAGAGAAYTALPTGLVAGAGSSAAGSGELYAIVSKHATWGVFDNAQHAYREAALIRESGAIVANPVRCSAQLAQQFQGGNLSGFVELDGWALTSREAEKRGYDYLLRARDRVAARRQLLEHQLKQARRWVGEFDDARADACFYGTDPSGSQIVWCAREREGTPGDCRVLRCSAGLYEALRGYLENDQLYPEISKLTSFHMLQEEHEGRLKDDSLYRIAMIGEDGRRDVVNRATGPDSFVAIARSRRWIFGSGDTADDALAMASEVEPYIGDEFVAERASATLVGAVLDNGYEVPGFWKMVRGVLRHEVEI